MTAYDRLREAILNRRQVRAVYRDLPREFCPPVLGAKGDKQHCLGYQFGGRSSSGAVVPESPENQRCFDVDGLTEVAIQEGPWVTAENWDRRQTCVDRVDVAVPQRVASPPVRASPLVRGAHELRPYSRATRGNIDVALVVNGVALK